MTLKAPWPPGVSREDIKLALAVGGGVISSNASPLLSKRLKGSTMRGRATVARWAYNSLVKELLSDRMREAVDQWIREHPEEVKAAVSEIIEAGAGAALMKGITDFFQQSMWSMQNNVANTLQQGR